VVVVVVQLSTRFREVWGQLKAREARGIETKNDRNTDRQAGLKSDKQNARGKGNKTRNRSWNHGYPFNERRAGDGEGCGLVLDVGVRWLAGFGACLVCSCACRAMTIAAQLQLQKICICMLNSWGNEMKVWECL